VKTCPPGKGLILDENENCVCPPGYAFDENGNCIPCPSNLGFIIDSNGRCVCDSSRGLVSKVAFRCNIQKLHNLFCTFRSLIQVVKSVFVHQAKSLTKMAFVKIVSCFFV